MSESIQDAIARALGVDPADVAGILGEAARAGQAFARADAAGRAVIARLEAIRARAAGDPLEAMGPDDADVSRRLAAIARTGEDPGPRLTPPDPGED